MPRKVYVAELKFPDGYFHEKLSSITIVSDPTIYTKNRKPNSEYKFCWYIQKFNEECAYVKDAERNWIILHNSEFAFLDETENVELVEPMTNKPSNKLLAWLETK